MNIFFLSRNPELAAKYHCDKHVVKMATEYAQLLSTALHVSGSTINEWAYKPTHVNHPCTIWVGQSFKHWEWLWRLGHHIGNEYTSRFHKIHAATRVLRCLPVPDKIPEKRWVDPPQIMPDEFKRTNVVHAYRTYYMLDKIRFASWKNSNEPPWWPKQEEKEYA